MGLRDLGQHRLKDIESSEHLSSWTSRDSTRPVSTAAQLGASSILPIAEVSLLGRDADLGVLQGWISAGDTRLLTLTGPGGSGKTSLAIALAQAEVDAFRDGVYFVPLQAAGDAAEIMPAIAAVLGLASDDSTEDSVAAHLRSRKTLLILDILNSWMTLRPSSRACRWPCSA